MLENATWQQIPGSTTWEIHPFERKPDVRSSNAYLLKSKECYAVVDPGGDDAQVRAIADTLNPLLAIEPKPVLIFLTHCHYDHFKSMRLMMDSIQTKCYLCVQERGADALEAADQKQTLSYLYNQTWDSFDVDVRLLTEADGADLQTRSERLDDSLLLQLQTECVGEPTPGGCLRQTVTVNQGEPIRFYHTPGHSPDSVSIQLGDFLFVGDLLFAANPGVAGIIGWNQKDLIRSLENVCSLILEEKIACCVVGHGRSLPGDKTAGILEKNIKFASKLDGVVVLDRERAQFLDRYAVDLLDEISELLSIVSGRLIAISYHLEKLEEEDRASEIVQVLDIDAIDRLLSEFKQFAQNYEASDRLVTETPLKAIQTVMKIQRSFDDNQLHDLIDSSLLRRIRWLMLDFVHIMQGFSEEIMGKSVDVNSLLLDYLNSLQESAVSGIDFLESSRDEDAFLKELIRRIALHNVFEKVEFTLSTSIGLPNVYVEPERFCDMLTALLEAAAVAGARKISFLLSSSEDKIAVQVRPELDGSLQERLERKGAFANRVMKMFGASLRLDTDGSNGWTIELQPASNFLLVR